MNRTKIDWATHSWNPVLGCLNSCPYCYARSTAHRWGLSFEPHWRERNFNRAMPRQPARIFVNSMSDICFWEKEWMEKVLDKIEKHPQHEFLFLSKIAGVYHAYDPWPSNCWLGVTATRTEEMLNAQRLLADLPMYIRFLSIEPILEKIDPHRLDPSAIDWVILAAESGNRLERVVPLPDWIEPFLVLPVPLFMKHNLPWSGPWWKEYPVWPTG